MGDSWYHRNKALTSTAKADECRNAAARLRRVADSIAGSLDDLPGLIGRDTWESIRADEWRGELDEAIGAVEASRSGLESEAAILDATAGGWEASAAWHWGMHASALAAEEAATAPPVEASDPEPATVTIGGIQ